MSIKKQPERRAGRNGPKGISTYAAAPAERPTLPARYADNDDVRTWFETYVNAPWSDQFTDTEFQLILGTLPLIEALHAGQLRYAAEIRRREQMLGATAYDRLKLDVRVSPADPKPRHAEATSGNTRDINAYLQARNIKCQP